LLGTITFDAIPNPCCLVYPWRNVVKVDNFVFHQVQLLENLGEHIADFFPFHDRVVGVLELGVVGHIFSTPFGSVESRAGAVILEDN